MMVPDSHWLKHRLVEAPPIHWKRRLNRRTAIGTHHQQFCHCDRGNRCHTGLPNFSSDLWHVCRACTANAESLH